MAEEPTFREYTIKELVVKNDPEHYEDDDAYEFSNGRKFKSTDRGGNGIYD